MNRFKTYILLGLGGLIILAATIVAAVRLPFLAQAFQSAINRPQTTPEAISEQKNITPTLTPSLAQEATITPSIETTPTQTNNERTAYKDRIKEINNKSKDALNTLTTLVKEQPDAKKWSALQAQNFDNSIATIEGLRNEVKNITPPQDLTNVHNQITDGYNKLAESIRKVGNGVKQANYFELLSSVPSLQSAVSTLESAMKEFEKI